MFFYKSTMHIVFVVSVFVVSAQSVLAGQTYTTLEGIPGGAAAGTDIGLADYISQVYSFAIWFVGLAAFLMIVIGGFMYISSAGNQALTTTAKTVIKDAFFGLFAALFAWLLLNVINPDLVNLRIQLPGSVFNGGVPSEDDGGGGVPADPSGGGGVPADPGGGGGVPSGPSTPEGDPTGG